MLDVISRIVLVVMLVIVAFLAPFWVTAVVAVLCIMGVALFVEAIIVVMVVEFVSRDFVGFGFVAWSLVLWLLVCESRRRSFAFQDR